MSKYEDPFEAFRKKKEGAARAKKEEDAEARLDRFSVQLPGSNLTSHRFGKVDLEAAPPPEGFESTRRSGTPLAPGEALPAPEGMERILKHQADLEAAGPAPPGLESGRFSAGRIERQEKPAGFESGRFDR